MAVTVAWLVRQSKLGLTVVGGAQNVDREILWAHAIELPDPGPFLSGGELVMTTGISVGNEPRAQADYVSRLVAADVAALAFDTGISYDHVPQGIVDAANALGLPVIQVPASTPFIAITRTVIDRINADQVKAIQRTVDEQERLARETLQGGIPAVVKTLARSLGVSVVALSPAGRLLAGGGPEQERAVAVGAGLIEAESQRAGVSPSSRVVADGDAFCTIQVLRVGSSPRGYLVVRADRPLTAAERLLISHSVSLISIELEKPMRILEAEQRLRIAVTRGLVANPPLAEPTLLRYFGFDPDSQVIVLVLTGGGVGLAEQTRVHRVLQRGGLPFLMWPRDDDIIVVLPATESESVAALHRKLSLQIGRDLATGVSPRGDFGGIALLVNQAKAAAGAGDDRSPTWFDRQGLIGTLLGDKTPAELAVLAGVLTPLDGEDLAPTLAAFLESNGHIESAAATLDVHRHTMRNRLVRISELLGMPLESADSRAALLIALRARALLGGPP